MAPEEAKPLPAAAWRGRVGLAHRRLPGAMLCGVVALAAVLLGEHVGGPPVLHALWLGLCLHAVGQGGQAGEGVAWCAGPVLRFGVALLGLRITFGQVGELGAPAVGAVLVAVASTMAVGLAGARLLGLRWPAGVLTGGASAICGASAALAIAAALSRGRDGQSADGGERFTALVVVGVSVWSTAAMVTYPLVAQGLGLGPAAAGLFLGGSIHDVAQVVGAAALLGPGTLDAAIVVKTMRIALLAVVVAAVAWVARGDGRARLPGYLLAFAALALLGNLVDVPPAARQAASALSTACMLLAIAAIGVKTAVAALWGLGWRPVALLAVEAVWIAALMLLAACVLPGLTR